MTDWKPISRTAGLAVLATLPVRLAAMGAGRVISRLTDRSALNAENALAEDWAHTRLVEAGLAGLSAGPERPLVPPRPAAGVG